MTDGIRLQVNPVACSGHGACAELLPELISLDEWGYPVVPETVLAAVLERPARRAVAACPALALRLTGRATRSAWPEPQVTR